MEQLATEIVHTLPVKSLIRGYIVCQKCKKTNCASLNDRNVVRECPKQFLNKEIVFEAFARCITNFSELDEYKNLYIMIERDDGGGRCHGPRKDIVGGVGGAGSSLIFYDTEKKELVEKYPFNGAENIKYYILGDKLLFCEICEMSGIDRIKLFSPYPKNKVYYQENTQNRNVTFFKTKKYFMLLHDYAHLKGHQMKKLIIYDYEMKLINDLIITSIQVVHDEVIHVTDHENIRCYFDITESRVIELIDQVIDFHQDLIIDTDGKEYFMRRIVKKKQIKCQKDVAIYVIRGAKGNVY